MLYYLRACRLQMRASVQWSIINGACLSTAELQYISGTACISPELTNPGTPAGRIARRNANGTVGAPCGRTPAVAGGIGVLGFCGRAGWCCPSAAAPGGIPLCRVEAEGFVLSYGTQIQEPSRLTANEGRKGAWAILDETQR